MEFDTLANKESVDRTIAALKSHLIEAEYLETGAEALERIKALIPKGVSVTNGSSTTLEQIGFIDYLKAGEHGWHNLKEAIVQEKDPERQALLRKQSSISDYYLGSVHAVAETGDLVIASATGSQMPHLVFTSQNLILVVSTQKIVPTLANAMERLESHVYPLEDQRMKKVYGPEASSLMAKILILKAEHPMMKRSVRVIFVNEKLGF